MEQDVYKLCGDLVKSCVVVGHQRPSPALFIESTDSALDTQGLKVEIVRRLHDSMQSRYLHERIEDPKPTIPLGNTFWPLKDLESSAIQKLFAQHEVRKLATMLRSRDDDARVDVLDAAYWVKGCSSLGRLRFAVVLGFGKKATRTFCLMDIKEATEAAATADRRADGPFAG